MPVKKDSVNKQLLDKLKRFLMFLLIASLVWLFMTLSAINRYEVLFNIKIDEATQLYTIPEKWNLKTSAIIEATWVNAVVKNKVSKKLIINEDWIEYSKGKQPYVLPNNHIKNWQSHLREIKLVRFLKDTLWLPINKKSVKKVPVHVPKDVQFRAGYKWLFPPIITPDSIEIIGAEVYLNSIKELLTDTIKKRELDHDIRLTLNLKTPFREVVLKKDKVTLKGQVTRFTERKITLPIIVKTEVESVDVEIFPKEVTLKYLVPLSKYKTVLESNFEVVAPITHDMIYSNSESLITPILNKKPKDIIYCTITPRSIHFFVKPK